MKKECEILIIFLIMFSMPLISSSSFGYNNNELPKVERLPIRNLTIINNIFQINGTDLFLNNITDVNTPSPSDEDILSYESISGKWINRDFESLNTIWQISDNIINPIDSSDSFQISNFDFHVNSTSGNTGIGDTAGMCKLFVDGNVNVTGNITVNDITVRSGNSLKFGEPSFATISAGTFILGNKTRNFIQSDGDFAVNRLTNQTIGLVVQNQLGDSISSASFNLAVDNNTASGLIKHSGLWKDPYQLIDTNERGFRDIVNSEKSMRWGFFDDLFVYPDLSLGEILNHRILIELWEDNFNINNTFLFNFSTGNFGIGTSNPQQELNIIGEINATKNISANNYCFKDGTCIKDKPKVKIRKSDNQTLFNSGTWNNITWDLESFDFFDMHNTTFNNQTITIKESGFYSIGYHVKIEGQDKTSYDSRVLLNNEMLETTCDTQVGSKEASFITLNNFYNIFNLTSGDNLTLQITHDDVGTQDIQSPNAFFQVVKEI